jgi:hypothetical protein
LGYYTVPRVVSGADIFLLTISRKVRKNIVFWKKKKSTVIFLQRKVPWVGRASPSGLPGALSKKTGVHLKVGGVFSES